MAIIFGLILMLIAIFTGFDAYNTYLTGETSIHQIYGCLNLLICTVSIGFLGVLVVLDSNKQPKKDKDKDKISKTSNQEEQTYYN